MDFTWSHLLGKSREQGWSPGPSMGTPCGHPAGRDCCRLCSSSRKADLMLLARGLPRPVRLRKDCWSIPDKSVQPCVVSAFLGVFLSQEQERISLMLNLFKSIYPRMLLTWKLIPLSWTGPALLHFPGRGHKGLTSESIFPHRSTSPAHFRDLKSKASFRVKKEKKEAINFLTHNFLCSLQEKSNNDDYIIITSNGLRSRECMVSLLSQVAALQP